jgi:hypothetical protein
VGIFSENIRDGFDFDPIELAPCPDRPGVYRNHLLKKATLPNLINADLSPGFTVAQVAEKHGWPEPMVWSLALDSMAGGGVTSDTCPAMGRRCRAFDMKDRPDTRPEIEPFTWEIPSDQGLSCPPSASPRSLLRPCRKTTSRGLPEAM